MADLSPTGLRVLREVAARGSFTAAAQTLGYTQSAVSRQVAALESAMGLPLFVRERSGVRLTEAGARLLPRAIRVLDELDAALADAAAAPTAGRVRVGAFPVAAAMVIPDLLSGLAASHPDLVVTLREATTPALVRSLRAGTLDLAVVARVPPYRPLDDGAPPWELVTLAERELMVGVGAHHPLADRGAVEVEELRGQVWVASPTDGDSMLGVWPGLTERADVRYVARDWLTKLRLVAAGLAVTTVAPALTAEPLGGIRLVSVRGEPQEVRRLTAARLRRTTTLAAAVVWDALISAADWDAQLNGIE